VGAEVAPAVPPPALWAIGLVLALGALAVTFLAGRGDASRSQTQPAMPVPGTTGLSATTGGMSRVTPLPLEDALDVTSPSQGGRSRYVEVAPLGEGGMARVSIAVTHGAEGFRRTFVVKRLKTEL